MVKDSKIKRKGAGIASAAKRFETALRQVEDAAGTESDSADSFLDDEDGNDASNSEGEESVDDFGFIKSKNETARDGERKDQLVEDEDDDVGNYNGLNHDSDKRDKDEIEPESDSDKFQVPEGYDSDSDIDNQDLTNLKEALVTAKERAITEAADRDRKIKKRKLYGDWAENAPPPLSDDDSEGEDSAQTKKKVTLDDIRTHTSSAFGTRALARLDELEKRSKGKSEVVKARLGRRIEQRVDRSAAYEIAKEEISKWDETVQQNRRAEHLEFPLQQNRSAADDLTMGLNDEGELDSEQLVHQLQDRKVSLEEVRARRNELRKMREQMFREEMKARRVKKIKSKTYRKIHKREREREAQVTAQLEGEDLEDDEDEYDKLVARARERMQLKHKNTSKWARDMKKMNLNKDKGNRAELEEMLRRGEELSQKVEGSDNESSGDELPSEDEEEEEVPNAPKQPKSIMDMKFMKDAEERLKRSNREEISAIHRMQEGRDAEDSEDEGDTALQIINQGRRRYGPGAKESQDETKKTLQKSNELEDDESSNILKKRGRNIEVRHVFDSEFDSVKEKKKQSTSDASNPWIQDVDAGSVTKGSSLRVVDRDSSKSEKTEAKLRRAKQKAVKAGAKSSSADTDADIQINVNDILQVRGIHDEEQNVDEVTDAMVTMIAKSGRTEFQQKELVKRAFAGDDVVRDFEDEKARVVEDEGDKEVDVTLPGWVRFSFCRLV